jgi:hypothetical protein
MTKESYFYGHFSKSLARTQAALALLLLFGLSGLDFFFPTAYSLKAGVHGLSIMSAVIFGTFMTHRVYPLIRG